MAPTPPGRIPDGWERSSTFILEERGHQEGSFSFGVHGDDLSLLRSDPEVPMTAMDRPSRDPSEVATIYGHPWPWLVKELVEEHAVEPDVDLRDLADRWGCSSKTLGEWVREHGYRVEDHRAVR